MLTVLLVEDDRRLAETVITYLALENIECDYASDGIQALSLAENDTYHVIILDLNLPKLNGLEVCQALRARGDSTPVIMLTARDQIEDKLSGFAVGTDDYLIKPFAMVELIARIRALSQRVSRQIQQLTVAGLSLNRSTKEVSRKGIAITISPLSFKLLEQLMLHAGQTVTKQQLVDKVWGGDTSQMSNLKVHIHKLRKDVDNEGGRQLIHTISSIGYMMREADEK